MLDIDPPKYNPDEKKLTWKQHEARKEKEMMREQKAQGGETGSPYGRCAKCNEAKFQLKCVEGRKIEQTCRNCGRVRYF